MFDYTLLEMNIYHKIYAIELNQIKFIKHFKHHGLSLPLLKIPSHANHLEFEVE